LGVEDFGAELTAPFFGSLIKKYENFRIGILFSNSIGLIS
jgi:hypothetical protein